MKKLLIVACLFAFGACKDDNPVDPNVETGLGVVIRNGIETGQNDGSVNGLILLQDGRTISPQSGFTEINTAALGSKFKLSFDVIGTNGRILNVTVKSHTNANDTEFTFTPPSTAPDSTATVEFLQGTFTGWFYHCSYGDCRKEVAATLTVSDQTNYMSTIVEDGYIAGGSGTMDVDLLSQGRITFHNTQPLGNVDSHLVLDGDFQIHAFNGYLSLVRWSGNDDFTSYLLKK